MWIAIMKTFLFLIAMQRLWCGASANEDNYMDYELYPTSKSSCNRNCQKCIAERCESCKQGRYGRNCSQLCPITCEHDVCDMQTGDCTSGCRFGYYGKKCQYSCFKQCLLKPHGCLQMCFSGCSDGYSGPQCECKPPCLECDSTGECLRCPLGKFGLTCEKYCSRNCKHGICDVRNGSCSSGCDGDLYGQHCNITCPGTCSKIKYGPSCHDESGACLLDCPVGFYGLRCANVCHHCVDDICMKDDGVCTYGCIKGYSYDDVGKMCIAGTNDTFMDRSRALVSSTSTVGVVLGVVSGVVVLIGCVVMAAICYRRKGQKTFNDSEVHLPVELPAISNSTYEMFEDMSGKRPANNNKFPALGAQIQRLLGKNNTTSPSVSNLGCVSENFGSSDVDVNYITPINSNMYDSIDGDQETSVAPIGLVHNSAPSSNTAKSPSIFFREPGTIHPNIETHREYHNVDLPVSQVRTTNSLMIPSTSDGYEAVGYEGNIYTDPDNLVF